MTQVQSTQIDPDAQRSNVFSEIANPRGNDALPPFSRIRMLDSVPTYSHSAPCLELSAVFCPTNRGANGPIPGLFMGTQVSEETGAQLRIIRSGGAIGKELPNWMVPRTSRPTLVIDLDHNFHSPLPVIATDSHPLAKHRNTDTALKRNISLALSLLVGDETVLNVDDDIMTRPGSTPYPSSDLNQKPLHLEDVLADLAHNAHRHVIGWLIRDQNDHSVVHHAMADLGHESNGIIGSGAQVIRCGPDLPFHPNIYNEDLLFLLPLLLSDIRRSPFGAAACAGILHQQHSDRYGCNRARSEELADVLAEALLWLMEHQPDQVLALGTSAEFWDDFLWHRQSEILEALRANRTGSQSPRQMSKLSRKRDKALMTALAVHSRTKNAAKILAQYVRLWQGDLAMWGEYLHELRPQSGDRLSVPAALERLGLTDRARLITAKSTVPRQLQPVAKCG